MNSRPREFPWHLILIAMIVVFIWLAPPLMRSPRPAKLMDRTFPLPRSEDVQARLWQDPFEAVSEHKRLFDDTHNLARFEHEFAGKELKPQLLIIAIVPSSGYAEDVETRLRSRYSIIAGLLAGGFSPDNESHIGFLDLPVQRATDTNSLVTIPYETFTRSVDGRSSVNSALLIWMQQDDLAERPMTRLNSVSGAIIQALNLKKTSIAIIGPRDSTTLKLMVHETKGAKTNSFPLLTGATILSPWATAPDYILFSEEKGGEQRRITRKHLKECGITFQSFSATDDQVLRELISELEMRRIDLIDKNDHIVLISEADTSYGRILPRVFRDEIASRCKTTNVLRKVHTYSYFRGLDGNQAEEANKQGVSTDGRRGIKLQIPAIEEPQGQAQYDYVRRLVGQIEADLDSNGSSRFVKAIGVLGSDVYDKIVLLQILRKRFPGAVFFTTDLDSRFFHPSQLDWTRNLIVGSGRDLTPWSLELRSAMPPFRDSYQTAQFLATLHALRAIPKELQSGVLRLGPKVFEIGRSGPVLIRGVQEFLASGEAQSFWKAALMRLQDFVRNVLVVTVSIGLLVALLLPFSTTLRRLCLEACPRSLKLSDPLPPIEKKRRQEQHVLIIVFLCVLVIASVLISIIAEYNSAQLEEPLSPFFEGISIWPSELIRLAAILLSLYFFYRMRWLFRVDAQALVSDFQLREQVESKPSAASEHERGHLFLEGQWWLQRLAIWRTWAGGMPSPRQPKRAVYHLYKELELEARSGFKQCRSFVGRTWNHALAARRDASISFWIAGGVSASILFSEYTEKARLSKRLTRVASMLPVVLVLAAMVFYYSVPFAPSRGRISAGTDMVFDALSGLCFIVLLLAVFDGVRLCTRFIQILGSNPPSWPSSLLGARAKQYKVEERHLVGWFDVRIVARHTEAIMGMVYYPFIVLFLLCAARHPFFDDWAWPPSVIAFVSLSGAIALWNVMALRKAAHHVKVEALKKLNQSLLEASDDQSMTPSELVESSRYSKVKTLRDWVAEETHGAYGPLSRDPLIGAILVPTGGAGLISLIEALMK